MNKNLKVGLIVLIIALIAGVAYGVMNMRPMTPEEEVMEAERRTANADSYSVSMDMDVEVEGLEETPEVSFSGSGDYDRINQAFDGEGQFDMAMEGLAANFGAGVTYVDDNLYGRVTTFPYLALPLGSDQVELITENDILLFEDVKQNVDLFLEGFFTELGMEVMTFEDLMTKSEELSEKMWEDGVITVSEVEEDELDGEPAKKYHLQIDGEKTADFVIDLVERMEEQGLLDQLDEEMREEMFAEIENELREAYEDVEIYGWVQDGYLVKIETTTVTEVDEDEIPDVDELEEMPESVTVRMVINYSNFYEEFDIIAPEEYITLDEVMQELQLFPMFDMEELEDVDMEELEI